MATQVTGYTITAGTNDEPELFVANVNGFFSQMSGFEDALWAMGDEAKSFLDGWSPDPSNHCAVVRHEKEDVVLTHP